MNIRMKLLLGMGVLVSMIILLVALSAANLQILTMTDPDSPAAVPGLHQALMGICLIGIGCIVTGLVILIWLPQSVAKQIKELKSGIHQIANHNYKTRLDIRKGTDFTEVAEAFNCMAEHLAEYRASAIADLISSKKFIEAIVNSIKDPLIGLNRNKEILFINDEALKLLNLERTDVLRKSAGQIALRNDLLRRLLNDLSEEHEDKNDSLKIYADSKESYFQVQCIPIIGEHDEEFNSTEDGKIGDVILLSNVTRYKEKDSAKTTFISTVSHELKTPVSAILMSLKLLEDQRIGGLNAEQKELAKGIQENSERLLSITGELLNMTQVETGKLQLLPKITKPIELIDYALKANRVQAERFNIHVEVEYPEKIHKLFVDSEKIAWVVTNLLSNAIRYSKENGRVIIGAREKDRNIQIYVTDFGKGIDPRYHESIFDRYFRVPGTKVQGSGLGLSISKDFVEAHKGTLSIDSEVGKGSTFTISLPLN